MSIETTVAAVEAVGPAAAAALLKTHKTSRIAHARAISSEFDILRQVARALEPHIDTITARVDTGPEVIRRFAGYAREHDISWWFMKGFALRDRYPQGLPRDVGDMDVQVSTLDDAWRLARLLREDGYGYPDGEVPWFKRDITTGELYGQVRVVTPRRDRVSVDFHAGPYSVRHCGRMHLGQGPSMPSEGPLSWVDNICCVLGNAAGDCFIDLKTVNDIVLCLPELHDASALHARLDEAGLLPFLTTCLDRVARWSRLDARQQDQLARLMPDCTAEPEPPLLDDQPGFRLSVTVDHARAVARRWFPDDPTRVEQVAATAAEAYGNEHPLRLATSDETRPARLPELNNWTCVRLVPAALAQRVLDPAGHLDAPRAQPRLSALTEEVTVAGHDCGDLVTAIGDTFVPTVDFALTPGLVATAYGAT
ncbi:nucleotidyltransferase family protein [Micromonospora sp. NPDC023644]|uniref:nucleotidyltransferase family protein n=1 Tax=Micromonospora sp. NPDC023644 TaxID=3154321 RepID=UPI0033DB6828